MGLKLTEGALATIMRGGTVENPVMQILGNRKIASNGTNERYRILVSDGCHLNSFAMLATQLNGKLAAGELADYTVIEINRFITSMVNSSNDKGTKRVMIILEVTVLAPGSEVGLKIGNPVPLVDDAGSAPSAPKPAAPQSSGVVARPAFPAVATRTVADSPVDIMHTHPIASLSPYQNRWVIKARVTNKSPIRTWSNARGEGKLFSMDLVDESGEIRATAFKEQCDKFYDLIEVNNVYFISRCSLKAANKRFTTLNNDYEMSFNSDTQVIPCHDDVSDIPSITFNFVPLQKVAEMEAEALVDVIGICKSAGEVQSFVARTTNRELKKREVLIVDETNVGLNVTMWGTQAEEFDVVQQPVLAVKGAKINEFGGGKSVSVLQSSVLQTNPDIPESHRLRGWFDKGGCDMPIHNISLRSEGGGGIGSGTWLTLREATEKQLGSGDKAEYFSCKATIQVVRSNNSIYLACPEADCNKKVIDQRNGMYRCEKCNREYPNYKHRLLMSMSIGDWSGHQWVTCFQEHAETILGMSADELGAMMEDRERFDAVFSGAAFKTFIFRLRAKFETFNDETRMKTTVAGMTPINHKDYNRRLINNIKSLSGMDGKK